MPRTVGYLYRGGKVLLAAQHFNIQPQQFRGANFDFVYWPRPQTTDLETLYFPELGIHLVRNLMDEVNYQRGIGRNVVTLVKHLDGSHNEIEA